ncbi:MAG: hypothetical protein ACD_75C00175G0002 [uncultured bacterium]|nr:MAG: hypothetical protein ACD_75C00175G0002 [uncultured bacterium]
MVPVRTEPASTKPSRTAKITSSWVSPKLSLAKSRAGVRPASSSSRLAISQPPSDSSATPIKDLPLRSWKVLMSVRSFRAKMTLP